VGEERPPERGLWWCAGATARKRVYFYNGEIRRLHVDRSGRVLRPVPALERLPRQESSSRPSPLHGPRPPFGGDPLELGFLTPEVSRPPFASRSRSVCDLFLWSAGSSTSRRRCRPRRRSWPEPIHTVGLAMEGSRWLDEYRAPGRVLVHEQRGPGARQGLAGQGPLRPPQRISQASTERKSLADLSQRAARLHSAFLEAAFQICVKNVLDIGEVGEEWGSQHPRDVGLRPHAGAGDREQVLVARRHMAIPLDLLERVYPDLGASRPTTSRSGCPPGRRDFYPRFDGRTPLGRGLLREAAPARPRDGLLLSSCRKAPGPPPLPRRAARSRGRETMASRRSSAGAKGVRRGAVTHPAPLEAYGRSRPAGAWRTGAIQLDGVEATL